MVEGGIQRVGVPKKKTYRRSPFRLMASERQHHLALMSWIKMHPLIDDHIVHIANERKCTKAEGRMLKRLGVRKGASDFFLPISRNGHHGLWMELKASRLCRVTIEQKSWLKKMSAQGYCVGVAYGIDEAIKILDNYVHGLL